MIIPSNNTNNKGKIMEIIRDSIRDYINLQPITEVGRLASVGYRRYSPGAMVDVDDIDQSMLDAENLTQSASSTLGSMTVVQSKISSAKEEAAMRARDLKDRITQLKIEEYENQIKEELENIDELLYDYYSKVKENKTIEGNLLKKINNILKRVGYKETDIDKIKYKLDSRIITKYVVALRTKRFLSNEREYQKAIETTDDYKINQLSKKVAQIDILSEKIGMIRQGILDGISILTIIKRILRDRKIKANRLYSAAEIMRDMYVLKRDADIVLKEIDTELANLQESHEAFYEIGLITEKFMGAQFKKISKLIKDIINRSKKLLKKAKSI
jgi:hypothetical protein